MSKTYSKKQIAKLAANWWTELLAVNMWQLALSERWILSLSVEMQQRAKWHTLPLKSSYIPTFNKILESEISGFLKDKEWDKGESNWIYHRRIFVSSHSTCEQIRRACDAIHINPKLYLPLVSTNLSPSGIISHWSFNEPPYIMPTGLLP